MPLSQGRLVVDAGVSPPDLPEPPGVLLPGSQLLLSPGMALTLRQLPHPRLHPLLGEARIQ